MTAQLTLFSLDTITLEQRALLLVTLDAEILELEAELKRARLALRESELASEIRDLVEQRKDALSRRASTSRELYQARRAGE
jgi:hypothetical protein